jgi:hypothetical protein
MWRRDSFSDFAAPTTFLTLLLVFTGYIIVPVRIKFKIAVLMYQVLQGTAP